MTWRQQSRRASPIMYRSRDIGEAVPSGTRRIVSARLLYPDANIEIFFHCLACHDLLGFASSPQPTGWPARGAWPGNSGRATPSSHCYATTASATRASFGTRPFRAKKACRRPTGWREAAAAKPAWRAWITELKIASHRRTVGARLRRAIIAQKSCVTRLFPDSGRWKIQDGFIQLPLSRPVMTCWGSQAHPNLRALLVFPPLRGKRCFARRLGGG